jgi:hypothetical protein
MGWVDTLIIYVFPFGDVYLTSCDFAMDPKKERRVCIKFYTDLGKSETDTLAMVRQAF